MQQAADAAFFEMVHALVTDPSTDDSERRENERHAYQCVQLIAPYDGVNLPSQIDFCKVQCEDISSNGFAFYSPKIPEMKYVIIALGSLPFHFYEAEVLHNRPMQRDGEIEYLVGCRLLKRLTD